jgi:integrase
MDGTVRTEQMTDEQMTAYMTAAMSCTNRVAGTFLQLELLTGMRLSELRDLEWADIDFQNGMILLREPKGGKDQYIPLDPQAEKILVALPRDPANPYAIQGKKAREGKSVKGSRSGRVGISTAVRYGKKFAEAAGLPKDFRPNHGLRHSFASALASSGEVDMYAIQRLLTHKDPKMTQRYAHLRDETLRRGASVMARIVTAASADQEKAETA